MYRERWNGIRRRPKRFSPSSSRDSKSQQVLRDLDQLKNPFQAPRMMSSRASEGNKPTYGCGDFTTVLFISQSGCTY